MKTTGIIFFFDKFFFTTGINLSLICACNASEAGIIGLGHDSIYDSNNKRMFIVFLLQIKKKRFFLLHLFLFQAKNPGR